MVDTTLPLDKERRAKIVEELAFDVCDTWTGEMYTGLRHYLVNGCKGYANMTDEELVAEYDEMQATSSGSDDEDEEV